MRNRRGSCVSCKTLASGFSPTALPVLSQSSVPLAVTIKPDPLLLERIVTKRQLAAYEQKEKGNGESHGIRHGQEVSLLSHTPRLTGAQPLSTMWSPLPDKPERAGIENEEQSERSTATTGDNPEIASRPELPETGITKQNPDRHGLLAPDPTHYCRGSVSGEPLPQEVLPESISLMGIKPLSESQLEVSDQLTAVENNLQAPEKCIAMDFFAHEPLERHPQVKVADNKAGREECCPQERVSLESAMDNPLLSDEKSKEESPSYAVTDKKEDKEELSAMEVTNGLTKDKMDNADQDDLIKDAVQEEDVNDKREDPVKAVKRRSFSNKSTSNQTQPARNRSEEDDDETDGQGEQKGLGKLAWLNDEVKFFGTRKTQICVVAILFFIFAGIAIPVLNVMANFGSLGNIGILGSTAKLPPVYGKWQVIAELPTQGNTARFKSVMVIVPNNNQVVGEGQDANGPSFQLSQIDVNPSTGTIRFRKDYVQANQLIDKPIIYEGRFILANDGLYAKGTWMKKFVKGHFLHRQEVTWLGAWRAKLIEPYDPRTAGFLTASLPLAGSRLPATNSDGLRSTFMTGLVFFLGAGVLLAIGCLFIFGPSGKLNIWAKEEYIPSQFKSQHNKLLNELGKPLKPGGLPLGRRCEWRTWKIFAKKDLAITPEIRETDPHILVLGAGDKGKSRLLAHMITHDILANDRAVVVIDSDGGLSDLTIRFIAAHARGKEIAKRVVLIDPTYKGGSLAYNPLEMPDDGDLQSAASSIVYGFKAIYQEPPGAQSKWDAQVASILRNSALLLMANGKTLTELPTLLQDNDFRDILLEGIEKKRREKVEYGTLLETWGQYKRLARTDQWINWCEPILNRVTPMLSDPRIRPILTKPVGDLKLKEVIKNKQILIVKIPQGQLDQNANLLGSLIVTGLKQAALSLANKGQDHQPVAIYLDEFDDFIEKETVDSITSDTKKFKIGFVGCVKTLQDLPEDFRNKLITNVGTMCCFALSKKDGDILGPQMFRVDGRKIKHQTIQNFFNKVNTSPQFELISDEEKLNIDRVVGQDERTFFCYRVGTVAGVFHLKSHDFKDIADQEINWKLLEKMHGTKAQSTDKKADPESKRDLAESKTA